MCGCVGEEVSSLNVAVLLFNCAPFLDLGSLSLKPELRDLGPVRTCLMSELWCVSPNSAVDVDSIQMQL